MRIHTIVEKSTSGEMCIIQNRLAEVSRKPTAMTLRGSNLAARIPAMGMNTASAIAPGESAHPVRSAE